MNSPVLLKWVYSLFSVFWGCRGLWYKMQTTPPLTFTFLSKVLFEQDKLSASSSISSQGLASLWAQWYHRMEGSWQEGKNAICVCCSLSTRGEDAALRMWKQHRHMQTFFLVLSILKGTSGVVQCLDTSKTAVADFGWCCVVGYERAEGAPHVEGLGTLLPQAPWAFPHRKAYFFLAVSQFNWTSLGALSVIPFPPMLVV